MSRKLVLLTTLIIVLVGTLGVAFNVQKVIASGTIYIRPDGSIDPPTTPISTVDNVTYVFTDNIYDEIVVERSNIIIDGRGFALEGNGSGYGFTLQPFTSPSDEGFLLNYVSNVTIKNTNIKNFGAAVSLYKTSDSRVSRNNINASYGIILDESSNNTVSDNNITASHHYGISLWGSQNNEISKNSVTATIRTGNRPTFIRTGILLAYSSNNNSLIMNNVTHCENGIQLWDSSDNVLRNNIMADNEYNFLVEDGFMNDVDTSNTIDGKPIYYLINKQDLTIPSEAEFVALINCTRMTVQGLAFSSHNKPGMLLAWTANSTITKNNITRPGNGIKLHQCSNNSIFENNITTDIYLENSFNNEIFENNITFGGIYLRISSENTVSGNTIARSENGLNLYNSSKNVLSGNNISKCEVGIRLDINCNNNTLYRNFIKTSNREGMQILSESSHNLIYENNIEKNNQCGILVDAFSSNNTIFENNIANNNIGIRLVCSPNNTFYHNDLINNTQQVDIYVSYGINFWDNCIEGNYWSDYNGTDSDYDGIGNTPYIIDANNIDNYPLMGMFHSFNTSLGSVYTICNSTVSDFQCYYDLENQTNVIKFNVNGTEGTGFCRICIPHPILNETYTVLVDGYEPDYVNYDLRDNGTHHWIYFAYQHSIHEVIIVPEFPSFAILPLFMLATLLAVIVHRRKHTR